MSELFIEAGGAAVAIVTVEGIGDRWAEPAKICLRRRNIAEVLPLLQNSHHTMLNAVFNSRNERAADHVRQLPAPRFIPFVSLDFSSSDLPNSSRLGLTLPVSNASISTPQLNGTKTLDVTAN